jgi:hypothetical protein
MAKPDEELCNLHKTSKANGNIKGRSINGELSMLQVRRLKIAKISVLHYPIQKFNGIKIEIPAREI